MVDAFLAGSVSGCCTVLLLQPLDRIKTLRQLSQHNSTACNVSTYKNVVSVFHSIRKREVLMSSLWRGTAPSLYRCIPGVGMYFTSIEFLRDALAKQGRAESRCGHLLIGMCARGISAGAMIPLTVVKTRYESGLFNYRSVHHALREMFKHHGVRGLFSGGMATVMRDAPYAGLFVLFYFEMKRLATESWGENKVPFFVIFGSSIMSGMMASVLTHPFDVIKTRIQVNSTRVDLFKTISLILREGGVRGMMTGLTLRMTRKMLVSAFNWTFYESISRQVERVYST